MSYKFFENHLNQDPKIQNLSFKANTPSRNGFPGLSLHRPIATLLAASRAFGPSSNDTFQPWLSR
jgi:hypothetical protein